MGLVHQLLWNHWGYTLASAQQAAYRKSEELWLHIGLDGLIANNKGFKCMFYGVSGTGLIPVQHVGIYSSTRRRSRIMIKNKKKMYIVPEGGAE